MNESDGQENRKTCQSGGNDTVVLKNGGQINATLLSFILFGLRRSKQRYPFRFNRIVDLCRIEEPNDEIVAEVVKEFFADWGIDDNIMPKTDDPVRTAIFEDIRNIILSAVDPDDKTKKIGEPVAGRMCETFLGKP